MASVGWKRVMWRVQALGAADEFRQALQLARTDAYSKGRESGVHFDPSQKRFLRFLDADKDGMYSVGETVIQGWTALPDHMVIHSVHSSISTPPTVRLCETPSSAAASASPQFGTFSLVFRSTGEAMATFQAKLGIESFPKDTFRIEVLPPTGLVTMER